MGYYATIKKADDAAREALRNIVTANAELARADGLVRDAQAAHQEKTLYFAKATQAEAQDGVKKAKHDAEIALEELRKLRSEIVEDAVRETAVNPEAVDMAAVELMKSGIMRPADYRIMATKYSGNATMTRLLGAYAQAAADAEKNNETARTAFTIVAHDAAKQTNPERNVDRLDLILDVFGRCIRNNNMIGHYETLTEPATGRRTE